MNDVFTSRAVPITLKATITWKQRLLKLKAMDVRLLRIELINRNTGKWCEIRSKLTRK